MIISQQAGNTAIAIAVLVFLLIGFLFMLVSWITLYRPWVRAFLAGAPVSLMALIRMKYRRINANKIVSQGISAKQAGFPIACDDLERAVLMGADLEKVVLAYVTAQKRGLGLSFEEILDADREERLRDLLS